MELNVQNPQDFPWWTMRLTFLMDNKPESVLEMFQTENGEALLQHLDRMTLATLRQERQHLDMSPDLRQELLQQIVCPPEEMQTDVTPMPWKQREPIWEWTEQVPDRVVTMDV